MTPDELNVLKRQHAKTGLELATVSGLSGAMLINGSSRAPVDALLAEVERSFAKDEEISRLRSLLSLVIEKAEPFRRMAKVFNEDIEGSTVVRIDVGLGDLRALSEAVSKAKQEA